MMTPQEIVSELDKNIVGQDAAKRAVAIALRNRWRRAQVPEPLRQEITPKNILMIGPTRRGRKTEVHEAPCGSLANAPFIMIPARPPSSPRWATWGAMWTRSCATWRRSP